MRSRHLVRAVGVDEIKEELDSDRPIIAGISAAGVRGPFAQHVALIISYEDTGENLILIVNDPYPYQHVGNRFDPYPRARGTGGDGLYRIPYIVFGVRSTGLNLSSFFGNNTEEAKFVFRADNNEWVVANFE